MYILRYRREEETYNVNAVKMGDNLVSITGDFPVQELGFTLTRDGYHDNWDYSDFTTIYDELVDGAIFSNDGSVKPEEPTDEPEED